MTVITDEEFRELVGKNRFHSGLKAAGRDLYYDVSGANCIYLRFPETPLRVTYFVRVLATLGPTDPVLFSGGVLWLTFWDIGAGKLVESGWSMVERLRFGYGETRPLELASAHCFRAD